MNKFEESFHSILNTENDSDQKRRFTHRLLLGIIIGLWIYFPLSILRIYSIGVHQTIIIQSIIFVLINILFIARKSLKTDYTSYIIYILLFIIFISGILNFGLLSAGLILAPFIPIFARIVFDRKSAIISLISVAMILVFAAVLYISGFIKLHNINPSLYIYSLYGWAFFIASIIGLSVVFIFVYDPAILSIEEHEARFNAIFNGVNDAIILHDAKTGRILDVNRRMLELFGYSKEEVLRLNIGDLSSGIPPHTQESAMRLITMAKKGKSPMLDWHSRARDGRLFWMEVNLRKTQIGGKEFVIAVERDITARKEAEEALKKNEELFRSLFEHAPAGVCYLDINGRFLNVNPKLCQITGYSADELGGITFEEITHPEDHAVNMGYVKRLFHGEINNYTLRSRYIRKDKSVIWVNLVVSLYRDAKGDPQFFIAIIEDITERLKIDEELKRSQKLESLGILAGGIAHDFNNLLSGIFGYIDLAMMDCTEEEVLECLKKAIQPFNRAKNLSLQLLTFAKGGSPNRIPGNIKNVLKDTTLFALSGSNLKPQFSIDKDLARCEFDINQISQVINNIVLNALQAASQGGTLNVSAKNIFISQDSVPSLPEGNYIKIAIQDTGTGIQPDILPRIFDPFFTTKQKESGLGLSVSYSIIKKHDGIITVESEPGKGSVFNIYLPSITQELDIENKTAITHHGHGTIIVMDDEDFMREILGSMLHSIGYDAVFTRNGAEILKFFDEPEKSRKNVIAMILDLTVPGGMGGKELVQELKKKNIDIIAIAASGYADDPVFSNPEQYGFKASVTKPFRKSELEATLNRIFAVSMK